MSSSTESWSGNENSSDSQVEQNVHGSPARDVENHSLEKGSGGKEDNIGSTGQKGNEQNDLPHPSDFGQSENVSR